MVNLRDELIEKLIAAKISSPRMEADIILKNSVPNYPEMNVVEEQLARDMLKRRLLHEPLDKIIGRREFYKYTFKVNSDVLSPRCDTEVLVEEALALINDDEAYQVLDLGVGSGCILLSILKERVQASGTGVDVSSQALNVAKENALNLGVDTRVRFVNQSWNDINRDEAYDIIVSNPPYIPRDEIETLEPEVKFYDPRGALDGGIDGYDCYKEIAQIVPLILKKGGYILLEAGIYQAENIADIFVNNGLELVKIVPDLAGINRCVILKK